MSDVGGIAPVATRSDAGERNGFLPDSSLIGDWRVWLLVDRAGEGPPAVVEGVPPKRAKSGEAPSLPADGESKRPSGMTGGEEGGSWE